jgi:hypothetical protein
VYLQRTHRDDVAAHGVCCNLWCYAGVRIYTLQLHTDSADSANCMRLVKNLVGYSRVPTGSGVT